MSVLIIIPARGGSKGIPRKNIKMFHGKPLIVHTIDTALRSGIDGRVIVSTDDDEIADIAIRAGAEVPFKRPKEFARDESTSAEVVNHVLEQIGDTYDSIMLLQPTSPLRKPEDLKQCLQILQTHQCDAVVSVAEVKEHPYLMYSVTSTGRLDPYCAEDDKPARRQDYPTLFRLNGSIYVVKTEAWKKHRSFQKIENRQAYIMPFERSVDIDDTLDWHVAELLAREVFP